MSEVKERVRTRANPLFRGDVRIGSLVEVTLKPDFFVRRDISDGLAFVRDSRGHSQSPEKRTITGVLSTWSILGCEDDPSIRLSLPNRGGLISPSIRRSYVEAYAVYGTPEKYSLV